MRPSPIVLNPNGPAEYAVIWLHGLGASANDFVPVIPELKLADKPPIRFVFPQAPDLPVTVNGGYVMPAWYDIVQADLSQGVDEAGIGHSVSAILELIQQQIEQGILPQHIILAGFSQGGVIALRAALEMDKPPLGVMALSTYLPIRKASDNRGLNIFIGHGQFDDIAPISVAMNMRNFLQTENHQVEWHDYEMAHSVNAQEIKDISAWLQALVGN